MIESAQGVTNDPVGRKKQFTERILAPFRAGTLARIKRTLATRESRTEFVRNAVERELERRERAKKTRD